MEEEGKVNFGVTHICECTYKVITLAYEPFNLDSTLRRFLYTSFISYNTYVWVVRVLTIEGCILTVWDPTHSGIGFCDVLIDMLVNASVGTTNLSAAELQKQSGWMMMIKQMMMVHHI